MNSDISFPDFFKKIKHRPSPKSLPFRLFEACVLWQNPEQSRLKRLAVLHFRYRKRLSSRGSALYRSRVQLQKLADETGVCLKDSDFADLNAKFLELVKQCNCPAPGCGYAPFPLFRCENPKTCPFCFVRMRLVPIAEHILELDNSVLSGSKIVGWARVCPFEAGLPFFSRRTGPHGWFNSAFSVQVAVPFYNRVKLAEPVKVRNRLRQFDFSPVVYHVGLNVVPADIDVESVFARRYRGTKMAKFFIKDLTTIAPEQYKTRVISSISRVLSFNWPLFFSSDAKEVYQTVHDCFPNKNLIRFQRKRD